MHHSQTHTTRNNSANHIHHNSPLPTKHHPLTNNNQPKYKNIVILQISINGIRNKIDELKTSYTALNQTSSQHKKQNSHRKLKHQNIPHYTVIRTDREHKKRRGLLLSTPHLHRRMVEGSNNLFYAHRPMVSPSNRNPGPLVDWWPPPFNQQVPYLHGSRTQIRDL